VSLFLLWIPSANLSIGSVFFVLLACLGLSVAGFAYGLVLILATIPAHFVLRLCGCRGFFASSDRDDGFKSFYYRPMHEVFLRR